MKFILVSLLMIFSVGAFAQNGQVPMGKPPRVMELEDKLAEEASRYFSRRFPNEPFFVRVDVNPLRNNNQKTSSMDNLPYLDVEEVDNLDEWDDPTTPVSFLRNKVIKVTLDIDVPKNFDDAKITEIKQDMLVYLKLVSFRDEVRVEKKLNVTEVQPDHDLYYILGGLFLAAIMVGGIVSWGFRGAKNNSASAAPSVMPAMSSDSGGSERHASSSSRAKSSFSSDSLTLSDPFKTAQHISTKVKKLEAAGDFPCLRDLIELEKVAEIDPKRLGAIIHEFSPAMQTELFKMGRNSNWLQAFSDSGRSDMECLESVEKLSYERSLEHNREFETLIICLWRLNDQAVAVLKGFGSEHALHILSHMPKSVALSLGKRAFPGKWGELLENRTSPTQLSAKVVSDYTKRCLDLEPWFEHDLLVSFKKDREILSHLNEVSIEDEKDIYESIPKNSLVHKARYPFYKVFELQDEQLNELVALYPLDKLALVVMNSSRKYIRVISDRLDEKKKMVFSSHLKKLDQSEMSLHAQVEWRQTIAREAFMRFKISEVIDIKGEQSEQHQKTA